MTFSIMNPQTIEGEVYEGRCKVINRNNRLVGQTHRGCRCAYCSEELGTRKVYLASDGAVVHERGCREAYTTALKLQRQTKERLEREIADQKRVDDRAATVVRRSADLYTFCAASFENYSSLDKAQRSEFNFFENVRTSAKRANETLDAWKERLGTGSNPLDAFSWSMDAFAAAAMISATNHVTAYFERGLTVEEIKEWLLNTVVDAARSPARSTSPSSNLCEQELTSAYAKLLGRR